MKIVIFGGTFNPVHRGHLLIAENACKAVSPNKLLWIPCAIPPHKESNELIANEHRIRMVQLAIQNDSRFETLDFEIKRGGISYSIDTVEHVRERYSHAQIFLMVGSDNFRDIGHWKRFPELCKLCDFLVIQRPGCQISLPPPSVPHEILPHLRYIIFDGPTMNVSSSEIRHLISEGKNVSHFLVPPVYDYIKTHRLYQT